MSVPRSARLAIGALVPVLVLSACAATAAQPAASPAGASTSPRATTAAEVVTPAPSPTLAPGYGSAPPDWPSNEPVAPASALPAPDGSPLPAELIGRQYNVDPPAEMGSQALVLTLRAADDPHCTALYQGASTCFTVLWQPNYPTHAQDAGVRGPARIVDGNLVLGFAVVPWDLACQGTTSTYKVLKDGDSLVAIDAPGCSFDGFAAH